MDENGIEQTAQANEPRIAYDNGENPHLLLDASLKERAIVNPSEFYNPEHGTWILEATLDHCLVMPGTGLHRMMSGTGRIVFVYEKGQGRCYLNGQMAYQAHRINPKEPTAIVLGGLAKVYAFDYRPAALSERDACKAATGEVTYTDLAEEVFAGKTARRYDPYDYATLFQDESACYPVETPGDVVGLALNVAHGGFSENLCKNGDFSQGDKDWEMFDLDGRRGWVIRDGKAMRIPSEGSSTRSLWYTGALMEEGKSYLVGYTRLDETRKNNTIQMHIRHSDGSGANNIRGYYNALGKSTWYVPSAPATGYLNLWCYNQSVEDPVTITDVFIHEIAGEAFYQNTTTSKPTLHIENGINSFSTDGNNDYLTTDLVDYDGMEFYIGTGFTYLYGGDTYKGVFRFLPDGATEGSSNANYLEEYAGGSGNGAYNRKALHQRSSSAHVYDSSNARPDYGIPHVTWQSNAPSGFRQQVIPTQADVFEDTQKTLTAGVATLQLFRGYSGHFSKAYCHGFVWCTADLSEAETQLINDYLAAQSGVY